MPVRAVPFNNRKRNDRRCGDDIQECPGFFFSVGMSPPAAARPFASPCFMPALYAEPVSFDPGTAALGAEYGGCDGRRTGAHHRGILPGAAPGAKPVCCTQFRFTMVAQRHTRKSAVDAGKPYLVCGT